MINNRLCQEKRYGPVCGIGFSHYFQTITAYCQVMGSLQPKSYFLAGNQLYLSSASSWEICIKTALNKLPLPEPPNTYIPSRMASLNILPLAIKHHHTFRVYQLPLHHRDPFDRILIGQAQTEKLNLMSADGQFQAYEIDLLWGLD